MPAGSLTVSVKCLTKSYVKSNQKCKSTEQCLSFFRLFDCAENKYI